MKLPTFSVIWSLLYAVFGLGLLFVPTVFMSQYGIALDAGGSVVTRVLGAAVLSFAVVFYLNRHLPAGEPAQHHLLAANFLYNLIDIPILLLAVLGGTMNAMGWVPLIVHIFLAASMGYFAFGKRTPVLQ